jgi:hypothetical protein
MDDPGEFSKVPGREVREERYLLEKPHEGLAPLDEHLGLGAGALSPGLGRVACRLGVNDSFAEAADALEETIGVMLADEPLRRVTEGIGQVAEAEAQSAVSLAQAGKDPLPKEALKVSSSSLLVEVDGTMVHEVDGQWHEAKAGLAAPLGPKLREDERTGRATLAMGRPSYCVGFESAELFWYRVYVEACRRGLGTALVTLVVVLGDGAGGVLVGLGRIDVDAPAHGRFPRLAAVRGPVDAADVRARRRHL